jgi:methyl-accepting chemotaxis protein
MKILVGRSDIEDALGRLDRLTQEEVRMAAAQGLKATHQVDNKVDVIDDKVQAIDSKMKVVDDKVQGVKDKVQQVADDMSDQKRSTPNNSTPLITVAYFLSQGISYERTSETGSLPRIHL